ncbi:MAG: bacillithiol biosynthesis cysteine-adding enzyme BshC [Flavobacteriales bacterium]|nr:bacillithiol biosynthesis cysteine-adding enzyme BshC [Flavobacteriales bacterium]
MEAHTLSYAETGRFTPLVLDYLTGDPFLKEFQQFTPDLAGLRAAAANRRFPTEDRAMLVRTLRRQYEGIDISGPVSGSIAQLEKDDALTVTTGHQLCLFTGPLYVPFKLLNAIRLARTLTAELRRPVVPVFWMASEDHDRDEIDHVWMGEQKVVWPGTAAGAVGRMAMNGIESVLAQLHPLLGAGAEADHLREELRLCYRPEFTLAQATRRFVHALFGRFGLVIIDGDDRELKKLFAPVMREELLNGIVQRTVAYADERLRVRYPAQAHARAINLFHLREGHRSRIEVDGEHYRVLSGGPRFTADEMLMDLELRPQDYSPNVLLRPAYQEVVLPNIAYIGGGGELAYWMQLRWLFQSLQLPMPMVLLRTSAAFLSAKEDHQRARSGVSHADLFKPAHQVLNTMAHRASGVVTDLVEEQQELDGFFARLRARASAIDGTLGPSTEAASVRAQRMLINLQTKMDRALRRREAVQVQRTQHLLATLFPAGGLQERTLNILPMLASLGPSLLDELLEKLDPLEGHFTILVEN